MSSTLKIGIGAVISIVACLFILYVSMAGQAAFLMGVVGSVATLALALGVLLIGTSESEGRPV